MAGISVYRLMASSLGVETYNRIVGKLNLKSRRSCLLPDGYQHDFSEPCILLQSICPAGNGKHGKKHYGLRVTVIRNAAFGES